MSLGCGRASRLSLASVGGHATAAERLELEAHLAACSRCSAEHAALGAMRAALGTEPAGGLGAAARERVRRASLAAPRAVPAPARRLLWPAGLGAAAVAAAIALWVAGVHPRSTRVSASAEVSDMSGDVVVAPDPGPGLAVTLRSRSGGRARLHDAATELARGTEIAWEHFLRSVELRAGTVTVDVEHYEGQYFSVRTPRFVVEVVGTRFSVDLDGVRTERGKVRVLSPDGALIAYVEAGQAWKVPATTTAAAATNLPGPTAGAGAAALPTPAVPALAPPGPAAPPVPEVSADGAAGARLARARRALARGDAAAARRAVEPVFRASRDLAAEARAIHAESYLVEGRHADAIEGYEIVVRDFPGTPQAESALYAVAQLESEHGRVSAARATLRRYLARYPHGRFSREAADRLAGLPAQPR